MKKQTKPAGSGNKQDTSSPIKTPARQESLPFPIVGIGASAGGLEALEQFLRYVPENSGMAFVIVQHLDPTHKGIMPEILQRATKMEVFQVSDRMRVRSNCVYVIPPNKDMSILHGVLHLFEPAAPRGLRLPIDFFLRSLAEDRRERSIGVILSGMGTDGTLGLRAINAKAGLALAQEPASAKFDSMPKSAINTGLVDLVAPAEELPGKIIDYLQHPFMITSSKLPLEEKDQSALEKIIILLRFKTGHDFFMYKKNTVYRRIERRMSIHQIDKIDAYVRYLHENSQEVEFLFKELLIGVTSFFRDPDSWEQLQVEVIPALLAARPVGGKMRAWSAGCSTGEEAYSLAIVFKEALQQVKPPQNFTLRIFATDLDQDSIDKARQGFYPANIVADVSPERLQQFFIKEESGYRVCNEIREMVTFATQNLIMDPPFTKLDILICRNLLIYLTPELQKKLIPLFHYSLNPDGALFLGSAESVSAFTDLFELLNIKSRLFRRRESLIPAETLKFPPSFISARLEVPKKLPMVKPAANLQSLADQLLLQHFFPPAVLTNAKGDILYTSGRTGKYLEPAVGKTNMNIFVMAREGLRFDLSSTFQRATQQKGAISSKGLKVGTNGGTQIVDITVQAIEEPEALRGMVMIVFIDVAKPRKKKAPSLSSNAPSDNARILELELELQHFRKENQATRDEMQSSQEELISTNEELQSTNEELQSTNEEMSTSKEEMQSLNEELQIVNTEQQSKMDEFARVSDDMRNLLNSTEIVTVFLDIKLNVRRFTTGANKLFKLIPGDVGRPLSDIVSDLLYPEMSEEAREVLRTLAYSEKQITTTDGRWFSVRIMPYRTIEDLIGGVVITFANITNAKALEAELQQDITKRKQLEAEIQDAREYAENIVETVREPLVVLNSDLKILTANHSFYDTFKVTPEDTIGNFIYDLGNRQWDIPALRVLVEEILPHDTVINGYEVEHDFLDIGRKIMLLNARQIFREDIGSHIILLAMEDITERKQLEAEIQYAREYAENIVETVREPMVVLNSDLKILTANHSFYETFKVTAEATIGNFIYDLGNRQWDIPKLRVLLEEILPHDTVFNGYEVEHDFLDIGRKTILLNARQIFRENIGSHIILLAMEDITERKLTEERTFEIIRQ